MSQHEEHFEYSQPGEDRLFEHTYDGIQEYDNPLPGWWKNIFWASIVFAFFYVFHYHMGGLGQSIHADYNQEVAAYNVKLAKLEAERAKLSIDKQITAVLKDKKALADGRTLFVENNRCSQCHGTAGEGGIGPNLTDNYWIHGPKAKNMFRVIRYGGREGKGMIAWGKKLKYQDMIKLVAYVTTLRGTKPANPKPPEKDAKLYNKAN
ncbi:MAG: c-type cytochrome [Deltaproteobacteria bacterium]|nr:MAG: c-type cytochrome [Deltaproteobacteria bacterium]